VDGYKNPVIAKIRYENVIDDDQAQDQKQGQCAA